MRPLRSFLLLLLLLALFAGFDYFFPGTGMFPTTGDFLPTSRNSAPLVPASSEPAEPPVQNVIADTAARRTTLIDSLLKAGGQVRIMYYGDSQIEGDRITSRLREELTGLYGGSGPGLFLPLMPMMYTQSYWLKSSPNWKRYNYLSYRKGEIPHNDLGPFMALCRYLPPGTASASPVSATVTVKPSPGAGTSASRYENLKLLYRLEKGSVECTVEADGMEIYSGLLETSPEMKQLECVLDSAREVSLEFTGRESPDIYGISIEGSDGVIVDNIPQRGSAGLEFTMVGGENLRQSYALLKPDLFILHYGINVVRNVKDDYDFYRIGLERQLALISEATPGAGIVLVSLTDMAESAGDSIIAYHNINAIVATQSRAALNSGSTFWNCYEAMGGEGSIIRWAGAEEPLASKDFVHLTSRGGDSLAAMMISAVFAGSSKAEVMLPDTALKGNIAAVEAPAAHDSLLIASDKSSPSGPRELAGRFLGYDPEQPFIFTSPAFWLFMLIVLALYLIVYRLVSLRNIYLLVVSLFFYYKTGGMFLLLLVLVTVTDYICGLLIHRSAGRGMRRLFLLASLVSNLGILAYFKYSAFVIGTLNDFLGTNIPIYDFLAAFSNSVLGTSFSIDGIMLPVGISFFTFQSLSYTIDIYRKKLEPVKSILDFGFYVSFFPQLVAGPIVRASEFIPQLKAEYSVAPREYSHAIFLILKGLIKKVIISDFIAVSLIDRVFEAPAAFSGFENLIAVYGYGLQIYCDFSGYTDIAIGIALILGFRLPLNFNSPYKAADISDFWRRWHISLSRWLKDYLYIPLGGNRKGRFRTGINLMLTMTLGGLWHGASLRFIVWGALHGAGLALSKAFGFLAGDIHRRNVAVRMIAVFLTFNFVSFCWIFFRAPDFESVATMLSQIGRSFSPGSWPLVLSTYSSVLTLIAVGYLIHLLPETVKEWYRGMFIKIPLAGQFAVILVVAAMLWQMRSADVMPFIYFRF